MGEGMSGGIVGGSQQAEAEALGTAATALRLLLESPDGGKPGGVVVVIIYEGDAEGLQMALQLGTAVEVFVLRKNI